MNSPNKGQIVGREPITGDPNVLRVLFRDGDSFVVLVTDWIDLHLKIGIELTELDMKELEHRANVVEAYQLATRYLTGRVRTAMQVRQYLIRKQVQSDVVEAVIMRLQQLRVVDDELYAQLFVEQSSARMGRQRVFAKLRGRGIPPDVASEAITAHLRADDEEKALMAAAEKFIRQKGHPTTREERAKLMNHLARKGFSLSQIRSVVNQLLQS